MSNMLKKFRFLEIGCRPPEPSMSDAVNLAKSTDVAIVIVGSSDNYETEAEDRPSMKLTGEQDKLIESIVKVNKNTIVVMNTGSPIEMPWIDQCTAVLQAWLPGQEYGNALSNLLFGSVNPSGKLPVTFPKRIEDNPSFGYYPGGDKVVYNEGIYVGYRHYETRNVEPLFPFGHGLSYTEFDYLDLECPKQVQSLDNIELNFSIKNIGKVKGQEVIQCYVRDVNSSLDRPIKELKAFQKISLLPEESKIVNLSLDKSSFSFFDDRINKWIAEPGSFEILIGSSSKDIRLKQIINYNN
jgi:beta-glucosidase